MKIENRSLTNVLRATFPAFLLLLTSCDGLTASKISEFEIFCEENATIDVINQASWMQMISALDEKLLDDGFALGEPRRSVYLDDYPFDASVFHEMESNGTNYIPYILNIYHKDEKIAEINDYILSVQSFELEEGTSCWHAWPHLYYGNIGE